MAQQWHQKEIPAIEAVLDVQVQSGLATAAAKQRLDTIGPNELQEKGRKSPWLILWQQISSVMVLILILAAVVSAFLGKATEATAIAAIVVLFALLGFVQEYRAEQAMAALKRMSVPVVRARRNGRTTEISARELVPGDVVLLEAGNIVPADLRLAESANLRIQEAALTGESEPVEKETAVLPKADIPLGDRKNMAYMGTNVTYGRGVGVVVETGMNTELGKIATLIQEVETRQTPLQQKLDQVGKLLAALGILAAALVLVIGVLSGEALDEMFLTAVSVAVAVVPEGLPAVVTITLALGAQRMLRRRALVRKLPAVETLGSVTIICTDKTGTLTENRMTVTVIDVAGHSLELAGTGHTPPALQLMDADSLARQPSAIAAALAIGALCNDASLQPDPATGKYQAMGDPTEGALLVAAAQAHVNLDGLYKGLPRVAELPFDSDRKRMTTVHQLPAARDTLPRAVQPIITDAPYLVFTKGAVDGLMDSCDQVWVNGRAEPLDDTWRGRITLANEQMAQNGMRVLGMTFRWLETIPDAKTLPTLENNLIFLGLVGMIDPPRPEVKTAVRTAQTAGIRPIMITGDHPLTARFIAYDLRIATNGRVKTGENLNQMSPAELAEAVADVSVYARVTPEHKLRIVEALQQSGHIVAMTGDGVNDSPALKKADIGVAMGITGTDVAKEASEMVLLDDNFATIVTAVEEGRTIYDNIRRFVKFSIAGNVGKVGVMLFGPLLGMTVALLPLQLLWLNLLTDGLLGLGLGVEPAEKGIMKRPPRSPQASLFSEGLGRHVIWVGCLIAIVGLAIGYFYYAPGDQTWQTMIFTTLAFLQIGQALASRSSRASLFSMGLRSNPSLLILALVTFGLQLIVIYLPALERFFQVDPLSLPELLVCLVAGSLAFIAIEIEKWWLRRRDA
ncbi:MAG: cation-translocating P-type ATPase [Chloroflexi bacterium]|nr:cation-translocating P-type ATPase [Ardenticatenaceae bacterium]MBL1130722.1 cation-translocating P-type ATPase [Chloroflexota bacterium]NOG36816.1 cation-translocating P-type ATPase [Chloroflexota bacterium]